MFKLCVIVWLCCRHLTCSNSTWDFSGICSSWILSCFIDVMRCHESNWLRVVFHLGIGTPRPPRIVTVIKSNCSLSWKRTRLWRTGVFCTQELEVSKTSHLHRFRRNIGTAKDNNMANYIVINEHQQFCKAFVTFEHLWAWLFDFCVELAGWVWIDSVGTCKSLQDQNAGLPRASIGTRNHREASEFDEPVAEQFWLGVSWMNLTRQNRPPWECFPLALGTGQR